jgi:hypothetical protein
MFNFKSVFLVIVVWLSLTSCQTNPIRKELSAKEKTVKLAKNDQETSLSLYNNCKEKAKLETFYNIDDARIRAVEVGTNTAQIIYAMNYNGSIAYDVKFWLCK